MEFLKGKFCWNTKCPNASSSASAAWKQGWRLNSGRRVADLCEHCGSIFEQSQFCEVFHREDSGWRECNSCRKRLHCGCVVSTSEYVLADIGGVDCVACVRQEETCNKLNLLTNPSSDSTSARGFLLSDHSSGEEADRKRKVEETVRDAKSIKASSTQSPGRITRCTETGPTTSSTPSAVPSTEGTPETEKLQTDFRIPSTSVPVLQDGIEKEKAANELWTVVPLFEKMLTASDAGRIGRLVLPKASAEAFFPPISVPEGIPIKMPDMNGKEWLFQFRFWPNNSSRMYVLEGITPCVKAMQLVAGDVVTFSRREPGGQIVMGYRRNSSLVRPKQAGKESGNSSVSKNGRKSDDSLKAVDNPSGTYVTSRTTWEEAQELLTPPPGVTPSIMTIDGHRFEEYEEPPILAKRVPYSAVYGNSCASPLPG